MNKDKLHRTIREIKFLELELDRFRLGEIAWRETIKRIKALYVSIKHDPYTVPDEFKTEQNINFDKDAVGKVYIELQKRKGELHLDEILRNNLKTKNAFKKYKIKDKYKTESAWWEGNIYSILFMYELIRGNNSVTKETFELELNKNIKYLFDAEQSGHSVVYHVQESIISLERILGKKGYT